METGNLDHWPTVPGWVWLEECGGPGGEVVPFVRLSYIRGIEAVEFTVPRSDTLLLLWWTSINDAEQSPESEPWVPVWVWLEHTGDELLTCVSLDRIDDVAPRDLLLPTSARGRMVVRKAVAEALLQLSGEETVPAAVAVIESAQQRSDDVHEQPQSERTDEEQGSLPDDSGPAADSDQWTDVQTGPTEFERSQDGEENWPTVPVWLWLETDGADDWRAEARLSPAEDILPVQVQVPASGTSLVQLWFLIQRATAELGTHDSRSRNVRAWLWVEKDEDEPFVWFSFERVAGVRSVPVAIPDDAGSLAVLRERVGAAMVWITGCETPSSAAAELSKPARKAPETRESVNRQARDRPKSTTKKRTGRTSSRGERKMVIPRIRIVSGGLPGLGRRR